MIVTVVISVTKHLAKQPKGGGLCWASQLKGSYPSWGQHGIWEWPLAVGVRHLVHIVVDQETERLRLNRARPQP